MSADDSLEVEVKFYVADLQPVREGLLAAGAVREHPRQFERNLRFDTPEEGLRHSDQLLRLRQDERVRLTFKGPTLHQAGSEAKVREELEVNVDNFERMAAILGRLGFLPFQSYEKYRETFSLQGVEVVLDEMPFGVFVELEGEEPSIRGVAELLGLPWGERILDNYLSLMARVKAYYGLAFDDLTFANFAGLQTDLAAVLAG